MLPADLRFPNPKFLKREVMDGEKKYGGGGKKGKR
jgi:hypothetical protein